MKKTDIGLGMRETVVKDLGGIVHTEMCIVGSVLRIRTSILSPPEDDTADHAAWCGCVRKGGSCVYIYVTIF